MSRDAHQDGTHGAGLLWPLLPTLPVPAALSCSRQEQPPGHSASFSPSPG